jgi:hypothetical protein
MTNHPRKQVASPSRAKDSCKTTNPSNCPAAPRKTLTIRGSINVYGDKVMDLRVHLKICEACGCLWYRTQLETRVYCTACDHRFKDFPTPQSRKRRGRPRKLSLPTVYAVHEPFENRTSTMAVDKVPQVPLLGPGIGDVASCATTGGAR